MIRNRAGNVTISTGSSSDSVYSSTVYNSTYGYGSVTISTGAGNDTIYSNDPNVSINAGTGIQWYIGIPPAIIANNDIELKPPHS